MDFRSLLESLATSYSAGKNTQGAFEDAHEDLLMIYGENACIVNEAEVISYGLNNGLTIEELLRNFADRSGLDEIRSFADVFESCFRTGADISQVISSTRDIINDKISVDLEIKTAMAAGRNELNIMIFMPLVVFGGLSGMGSSMTVIENSFTNVVIKLIALGIFAGAYALGRKILKVKI